MQTIPAEVLHPNMCPLCYGDACFFLSEDQREYWRCPNCRLIFVPPDFFLPRQEEIERYLQHENSLENEGYVKMFREKIDIVKAVCPKIRKVLDYGCGYEPVLKTLLSREGYLVDGYDLNFFPQCDFQPGYDLIISVETFEHFKEPGKEIDKLVSLLSASRYIAVMTRFYPGEKKLVSEFKNWYYKRDPSHIAFYSPETFSWIAEAKGFKIVFNNEKDFVILQLSPDTRPHSKND